MIYLHYATEKRASRSFKSLTSSFTGVLPSLKAQDLKNESENSIFEWLAGNAGQSLELTLRVNHNEAVHAVCGFSIYFSNIGL